MKAADICALVTRAMSDYRFAYLGLAVADGSVEAMPSESAFSAKLIEQSTVAHITRRLARMAPGVSVLPAESNRTYPDMTLEGLLDRPVAVDVKTSRRSRSGRRTGSAVGLGPFDGYLRHPRTHCDGIARPYGEYAHHISLLLPYDFDLSLKIPVANIEVIAQESWRIASKRKASGTRDYIAAVTLLDDLRAGRGEFRNRSEFLSFWRSQPVKEKKKRTTKGKKTRRS